MSFLNLDDEVKVWKQKTKKHAAMTLAFMVIGVVLIAASYIKVPSPYRYAVYGACVGFILVRMYQDLILAQVTGCLSKLPTDPKLAELFHEDNDICILYIGGQKFTFKVKGDSMWQEFDFKTKTCTRRRGA